MNAYEIIPMLIMCLGLSGAFLFVWFDGNRRDQREKERFREFALAVKAKDVHEYAEVVPTDGDLPQQEDDELIDLDQVDPSTLLSALRK
jgi:hypothetical protein